VRIRSLACTALVLGATAGLAQTGTGHALMRSAGLIAAPAPYTALSFTNPQSLPAHLRRRSFDLPVSFRITNVSAAARAYQWSVLLVAGRRTRGVSSGRLTLAPGGTQTLDQGVTGSCRAGQVRIVVRLSAPAESIDFLASCGARA
jgi:hypothetical protein